MATAKKSAKVTPRDALIDAQRVFVDLSLHFIAAMEKGGPLPTEQADQAVKGLAGLQKVLQAIGEKIRDPKTEYTNISTEICENLEHLGAAVRTLAEASHLVVPDREDKAIDKAL